MSPSWICDGSEEQADSPRTPSAPHTAHPLPLMATPVALTPPELPAAALLHLRDVWFPNQRESPGLLQPCSHFQQHRASLRSFPTVNRGCEEADVGCATLRRHAGVPGAGGEGWSLLRSWWGAEQGLQHRGYSEVAHSLCSVLQPGLSAANECYRRRGCREMEQKCKAAISDIVCLPPDRLTQSHSSSTHGSRG